jgi:ribose/xylose/arabinose/galactoside ABC-type transport system permease subunit
LKAGFLKKVIGSQVALLALALLIIIVVMCIATDRFYQANNLLNILTQVTGLGIAAIGAAVVMISGGIDLTLGNIIAFSACSAAVVMAGGASALTGFFVGVSIATLCGILNGVLVVLSKAEPFIITLGMMSVYQGLTLLVTGGKNIAINTPGFNFGRAKIAAFFPIPVIFLLTLYVIVFLILKYTKFGRRMYGIGNNAEAAYLSGIKIERNRIYVYALNGLLLGIGAMILLSRLGSGNATMGGNLLMQAIAAAVIGGVAMSGGKGSVAGVFLGTLLIGIISNSLNLLQVPSFWQYVVLGAIIVAAVFISNAGIRKISR